VVVVKEFAAELQIQLAAELTDALADLFRLHPEVFVVVKADRLHRFSSPLFQAIKQTHILQHSIRSGNGKMPNPVKIYCGADSRLKRALEYLAAADLNTLEPGRYEIEGAEIFMKVTEGELKREEEASLEVHDKYIDVQVLIAGEVETMGWRERRECRVPRGPFDAEEDIRFFADRPQLFVGIRPGQFVVFGPEDAHAPMIGRGRIKKAVVKVMK
jgi:biofilm protein TabA